MLERNPITFNRSHFTACTANLALIKSENWLAV